MKPSSSYTYVCSAMFGCIVLYRKCGTQEERTGENLFSIESFRSFMCVTCYTKPNNKIKFERRVSVQIRLSREWVGVEPRFIDYIFFIQKVVCSVTVLIVWNYGVRSITLFRYNYILLCVLQMDISNDAIDKIVWMLKKRQMKLRNVQRFVYKIIIFIMDNSFNG